MGLTPGTRVGPYEVVAAIGAGGMGEVYRARDTKLGREVALKVLPPAFAQNADRLARFQREAQVLAALNHPNIAAIYGLEANALVMEFVPGEDLRGPLPVEEAVAIAHQIAEALEYAHEKGIIHRDLKPANVKITPDGQVKVLDFGLAKAMEDSPAALDVSHSPTMSLAATRAGVILGTAAYMSPEQAKGKAADRRADIWAFGLVLLELLTGKRAFGGDNASEVMAAVIMKDPEIPAGLPVHIGRLIRRCLAKDPRQRLQAIGEARITLEQPAAPEPALSSAPHGFRGKLWMVATGVLAAALVLLIVSRWQPSRKAEPVRRVNMELGADVPLDVPVGTAHVPALAISSDGTMLAFVGVPAKAGNRLFLRRLSHLQATALPGTEGASDPFFSPDGQWIAFVAGGSLRKISTGGGAAVALCPAEAGYGGAWVEDGYIYFSPNSVSPLLRVSPSGGQPEKFTTIDPSRLENSHRWVHALPGGKAVLFSAGIATTFGEGNLMVQETKGGPPKLVQRGATFGIYLPDGRIFFMRQGSPFVAPFDLERLEITGQEAPLAESISSWVNSGSAQVSFASDGKMVYLAGRSLRDERVLEWIDPAGKTDPLRTELGFYTSLRFSPDGHSLAVTVQSATSGVDYWLYQWERKTMSRFTSDGVASGTAAWTPDSRRLTFSTRGTPNIFWQPADGSAQPERLTNKPAARQLPVSWHPSGKFLLFDETDSTGFRLMVLPMKGSEAAGWKPGTPYAFLTTTNFGSNASFSPDGRWVAYESVETGRPEVYVRPFPGPGGKWQISNDGGLLPTWSRNGKELIYRASDGRLMTCAYSAPGQAFLAASPRAWSEFPMTALSTGRNFDLHPDGKRMARIRTPDTTGETKLDHVVVVENILEELRGLTKAKD